MIIPTKTAEISPSKLLLPRSFTSDVVTTAKSFKSWNSCMADKPCKIIAIVGIILAVFFVIWLLSGIARCLCCGAQGVCSALCCCLLCCGSNTRDMSREPLKQESAYDNPHMYPQKVVYDNSQWDNTRYDGAQRMQYGPGTVDSYGKNTNY